MGTHKKERPARGRLGRLVVCLVLFLAVFWGRGMDWAPAARLTQGLSALLQQDIGVQETFARVGESFSQGEPAAETFRALLTGLDWTRDQDSDDEDQEETDTQEAEHDGET